MILIEDYIQKSRDERRSHLNLNEECIERGGNSTHFKGLLAHVLGTTIPEIRYCYLCHACNNEKCSNVNHLYWGTPKDNHIDRVERGAHKDLYERTRSKYGEEFVKELGRTLGKNHGGSNRYDENQIDNFLEVYNSFDKKHGWKVKAATKLGISHTQLNRLIKKYV